MKTKSTPKPAKQLIWIGSLLLLLPAALHISGFSYVTEKMQASNAASFLKEIMPMLFAVPTVHLVSLATFGILSTYLKSNNNLLLAPVVIFVGINGVFAFYLAAYLPGAIMALSCACLLFGMHFQKVGVEQSSPG